jgi:hypothetical protein
MEIYFLPKTRLGKWSCGLIVALFLLLPPFPGLFFSAAGRPPEGYVLTIIGFGILFLRGATAILGFLAGVLSIFKNKERSIIVFVAILIGLFFVSFFLGEILFPH